MQQYEVISPRGIESVKKQTIAPRLDSLEGKTICETWNRDFKGDIMFPIYSISLCSWYLYNSL